MKVTTDDLMIELDDARNVAKVNGQASAMIAATMSKAKLLGLDKPITTVTAMDQAPVFNIVGVVPKVERLIVDTVADTVNEY